MKVFVLIILINGSGSGVDYTVNAEFNSLDSYQWAAKSLTKQMEDKRNRVQAWGCYPK